MPRGGSRRRRQTGRPRELRTPTTTTPIPAPEGWQAERYRGGEPDQDYTCPRCEHVVARRSEHVVAWRTDDETHHRHWHANCWEVAKREGLDRYRHW